MASPVLRFNLLPAVAIPPICAPLLGMATGAERLGQAPSSAQCDGVFRKSWLADACANGSLHCLRRVVWRYLPRFGIALSDHRPRTHRYMTMAYVIGDPEGALSFFPDPDKFIAAAPFAFLIVSLIVLIFGAGW